MIGQLDCHIISSDQRIVKKKIISITVKFELTNSSPITEIKNIHAVLMSTNEWYKNACIISIIIINCIPLLKILH